MRKNFTIFMITLFIALLSGTASAQRFAVKSNLLYDITSTINLGVEYLSLIHISEPTRPY